MKCHVDQFLFVHHSQVPPDFGVTTTLQVPHVPAGGLCTSFRCLDNVLCGWLFITLSTSASACRVLIAYQLCSVSDRVNKQPLTSHGKHNRILPSWTMRLCWRRPNCEVNSLPQEHLESICWFLTSVCGSMLLQWLHIGKRLLTVTTFTSATFDLNRSGSKIPYMYINRIKAPKVILHTICIYDTNDTCTTSLIIW